MVNAGRVLIIPKGAWTNLTSYEMLDLVSEGDKAYLARQASVGMRPSEDASMTYWQPFGSSASIATTDTPGLVMPDGVTITVDATGLIVANLNVSDLKDIKITNLANGDVLRYDGTQSKWVNVALGSAAFKASTNAVTQNSTALVESGAVYTALVNKENKGTIKTATLTAGQTTVTFTQMPTTGNHLVRFYNSSGINYTEIDNSVSGQVTLTFEEQSNNVTVNCEIKEVS